MTSILDGCPLDGEVNQEKQLRPSRMSDYIGQERVCEQMEIFLRAAQERNEALDHTLLYGPPGLGKTTLAHVLANELGTDIRVTSGPVISRPGDLAALLSNLTANQILFIDEIHRLPPTVEEFLYPAMEDYAFDIVLGEGPAARSVRLEVPPFTLIGATTRAGMLTSPMRDRFGIVQRLEYYDETALKTILTRSAQVLGVAGEDEGLSVIARRSRGTPRVANRLLKRVRDFAQIRGDGVIKSDIADKALSMMQVDRRGLEQIDREYMRVLTQSFGGGPVGVETLAVSLGEDVGTLEEMVEPYLMKNGLIQRGPRGRSATEHAYADLGLPRSANESSSAAAKGNLFDTGSGEGP